jgi:hypothetical protein
MDSNQLMSSPTPNDGLSAPIMPSGYDMNENLCGLSVARPKFFPVPPPNHDYEDTFLTSILLPNLEEAVPYEKAPAGQPTTMTSPLTVPPGQDGNCKCILLLAGENLHRTRASIQSFPCNGRVVVKVSLKEVQGSAG